MKYDIVLTIVTDKHFVKTYISLKTLKPWSKQIWSMWYNLSYKHDLLSNIQTVHNHTRFWKSLDATKSRVGVTYIWAHLPYSQNVYFLSCITIFPHTHAFKVFFGINNDCLPESDEVLNVLIKLPKYEWGLLVELTYHRWFHNFWQTYELIVSGTIILAYI